MTRRCANTLLIIAYLAGQLATLPHAHGESYEAEHSEHGARPHFHLGSFAHGEHGRDHQGTHSHEADGCRGNRADASKDGHDSDAVYLTDEVGSISLTDKRVLSDDPHQFVSVWAVVSVPALVVLFDQFADDFFPGKRGTGCPLYLTLRTLRI